MLSAIVWKHVPILCTFSTCIHLPLSFSVHVLADFWATGNSGFTNQLTYTQSALTDEHIAFHFINHGQDTDKEVGREVGALCMFRTICLACYVVLTIPWTMRAWMTYLVLGLKWGSPWRDFIIAILHTSAAVPAKTMQTALEIMVCFIPPPPD